MEFLAFIFGLAIGIGFYYWKRSQFNHRLKRILSSLPDHPEDSKVALPLLSRLRREVSRAQERSEQLEKELQSWQDQLAVAPIAYLQVDEENQLIWCNKWAKEWLKVDRWQFGQPRLLLEVVRSYELDQLIERTRNSQKPQVQEWTFHSTFHNPEDTPGTLSHRQPFSYSLPLKASSFPLEDGKVGVFLENQDKIHKLILSRDRLTSDLTHELRTPLTSIRLVTETLVNRLSPPEKNWAEKMLQETNRLIDLVQDWLEISQLEEDPAQHLHLGTVKIPDLILSTWQTLEPIAQQKGISLIYTGEEDIELEADSLRLTQVFLNLLDNGIKHSPPHSQISVKAQQRRLQEESDSHEIIEIDIVDAGVGFVEADLPRVFDRLYRGDPSRVREEVASEESSSVKKRRGSGLGLAIAQQIIFAHSGTIQAQNSPKTGGAWLQIQLPKRGRIS